MDQGNKVKTVKFTSNMRPLVQDFHSGNSYLDRFIKGLDALNDNFGKTYLLLSDNEQEVCGYFNLGTGSVDFMDPIRLKSGGSIHINEFALAEKFHKTIFDYDNIGNPIWFSDFMLFECIHIIRQLRRNVVGFAYITLNSTKEGYNLYRRNGFTDLDKDLFFSIEETDIECKQMYVNLADEY